MQGVRRLAVTAHYDPEGHVAPHVRHHLAALVEAFDSVVVVTTANLTDAARSWLVQRVRLIERENAGYDFWSYKVGLDASGDLTSYDEVAICNDTFVGPLVPWRQVISNMDTVEADFWGLTRSEEITPHLQSYFMVFRPAALVSPAFQTFWSQMEPVSDRDEVIRRYEIGLSQVLERAGLRAAAYFEPTSADRRLARRRRRWFAAERSGLPRTRQRLRKFQRLAAKPTNPTVVLADRAFDDARLPVLKIAALRYDQYGLGAERLLARGEHEHPTAFEGVRDYLAATSAAYGAAHRLGPRWARPLRPFVRYR